MAVVAAAVRNFPSLETPSPLLYPHTLWSTVKTLDEANVEWDRDYGEGFAMLPDNQKMTGPMCQVVYNKGGDSHAIINMFRQGMQIDCLNRQDTHGRTIAMLAIQVGRDDEIILPFLEDTRFDVTLQDSNEHDVLWYAAARGKVSLFQAIVNNPSFATDMYGAACQVAHKKRQVAAARKLEELRQAEHVSDPMM